MDLNKITTSQIRQALRLQERKESLAQEIKTIERQLADLLGGQKASPAAAPAAISRPTNGRRKRKKTRAAAGIRQQQPVKGSPRAGAAKATASRKKNNGRKNRATSGRSTGTLRERIIGQLQAAGPAGAKVADLARKLDTSANSLGVWFYTTGKKLPEIQKVAPGTFRLKNARA